MGKLTKVEGQVMIRNSAGINELEFYEENFILDDSILNEGKARQIIKKGLLTPRLEKKIKGFRRVRTCNVVEFTETDKDTDNSKLDKMLIEAIDLDCMPININSFKQEDHKTKALAAAIHEQKERNKKNKKKKNSVEDLGYID